MTAKEQMAARKELKIQQEQEMLKSHMHESMTANQQARTAQQREFNQKFDRDDSARQARPTLSSDMLGPNGTLPAGIASSTAVEADRYRYGNGGGITPGMLSPVAGSLPGGLPGANPWGGGGGSPTLPQHRAPVGSGDATLHHAPFFATAAADTASGTVDGRQAAVALFGATGGSPTKGTGGRSGVLANSGLAMTPEGPGHADFVEKGKWKLGKLIGSGNFGQVYQGLNNRTGALVAVKKMLLPDSDGSSRGGAETESALVREVKLMQALDHENIVRYLGAEEDIEKGELYIFQEWVAGGSLSGVLKRYGNLPAGLHEHRVVHRDIKGENVLIDTSGIAKLADFGASKQMDGGTIDETHHSLKGTPYYMAPEQMEQTNSGRKVDVWSMGGVALLMAKGDPPWKVLSMNSPFALFACACARARFRSWSEFLGRHVQAS